MLVNQNVKVRLAQHIQYAEKLGYDVIYGSIYGARNYGLDTEESDVDSYLVVMPSLEDIAMDRPLKSVDLSYKTDDVDTGEHIVIKDIRLFMKNILNGDPHALEAFYSEYFVCNKAVHAKYLATIREINCIKIALPAFYYRLRNNLEGFEESDIFNKLDWSLKKDRKTFINLVVLYFAFIHMSNGSDNPFLIESKELRDILVKIKKGEISKEQAGQYFGPMHMLIDVENRWNYKIPEDHKKPDLGEKSKFQSKVYHAFQEKFVEV